jgi:adenosylcobinamide-GDP ribazoletransferase
MLTSFLCALRRLTVLPVGAEARDDLDLRDSVALYPLAGLLIGAVPAAALVACAALRLGSPLAEILALAALAAVTGCRHLGELGRVAEAAASARPGAEALAAAGTPPPGGAGAAAAVMVVLVKWGALLTVRASFVEGKPPMGSTVATALAVLAAVCLARWSAVLLAAYSDPAGPEEGPGDRVISATGPRELRWALAFAAGATLALAAAFIPATGFVRGLLSALLALAGCSVFGWAGAVFCARRFGGASGACPGAAMEAAEALALVLLAVNPP